MVSLGSGGRAVCLPLYSGAALPAVTVPMNTLNPAVIDIGPTGLSLSCEATASQLGLEEPTEKFQGPFAVQLELVRQGDPITVTGTLEGTAIRQCVRCLTEYSDPLFVSLYAEFVRQSGATKPAETERSRKRLRRTAQPVEPVEEMEEEDEVYLYDDDHLDLVPMLREQVILAAPMQPLCREDCLGLCSQCGQNLNERRCACPSERGASPFRVLRGGQSKGGNA